MSKNKISVIIPAYNEQALISECLSALARQTVAPHEIIVVDNNSTDNTVAFIRQYYPQVKILHEPRQGIVFARNCGFEAASGDIIARIDADTQVTSGWIARLQTVFASSQVAAVGGQVWYYDRPCQRVAFWVDKTIRRCFVWSAHHQMLQGCNMALRTKVWRAIRKTTCRRDNVHEDMDLGIHLHGKGFQIVYDPGLLAGISARRLDTSLLSFLKYIGKQVRTYRQHGGKGTVGALCLCAVILVVYVINGVLNLWTRWRGLTRKLHQELK